MSIGGLWRGKRGWGSAPGLKMRNGSLGMLTATRKVDLSAGEPQVGATSGSMSGDGKRSVGHRPQATAPILDSTRPAADMSQPAQRGRRATSCVLVLVHAFGGVGSLPTKAKMKAPGGMWLSRRALHGGCWHQHLLARHGAAPAGWTGSAAGEPVLAAMLARLRVRPASDGRRVDDGLSFPPMI
jgi:hypothetical protein